MNWKQMKGILTHRFGELPNKENIALVRSCAAEGIVLLKNEKVLPLRGKKVALFGAGAVETIICGTGSGYVFPAYTVTVKDGLEHAGMQITSAAWLKRFAQMSKQANKKDKTLSFLDRMWSGKTILTEEPEISGEELEQARKAETAIYVIRRNAGEEADRRAEKGDYYLSDRERSNLERIAASFVHTVVVLNTCVMDAGFIEEITGIDAVVFLGMAGMEAGNALADVLTGKVNPSGRLADTWAKRYQDYPAAEVFSSNDGITLQEDYIEDIYVGYRWFDTMGIEPFYPFGYGLSYTEFQYKIRSATGNWKKITVEVEVKNTGAFAGKEVVQLYVSAPEGRLEKPYQELKAFAKTSCLKPGETELLSVQFATEDLSSFDEAQSAFVMESGQYAVRVGKNSRDTAVAAVIELDGEAVTRKVTKALSPDRELHLKKGNKQKADITPYTEAEYRIFLKACECRTKDETSRIPKRMIAYVPEGETYIPYVEKNKYQMPYPCREEVRTVKNCPDATLLDVYEGRVSLEEFVASLEPEVLTRIVTGTLEETPYAAKKRWNRKVKLPNVAMSSGQTTGQYVESLGIPPAYLFDGPAGMHIIGCAATSFPVGMTAAQTWDLEMIRKIGRGYGKDMESYHVTVGLGPGMNIHRDPLCGRNFEYYSEDPLLTGKSAAAFTKGVQSVKGRGVALKHFAANNQENDRLLLNNTISTRALREIYLRGFEICVREAQPMTVMSSYNKINGTHTSSNRDLITDILRGEWGFTGYVMTDWGTNSEKGWDLHAGNDLIMGGYRAEKLLNMLKNEAPEFEPDGSVKEMVKSSHFGMVKSTISKWGAFVPEAEGKATVSTTVAPGTEPGEKVQKYVEQGIADVAQNADGSRTVTYRGTARGAYLALGDLQACAMRVLRGLMNSAAMDELIAAKGRG